MEQNKNTKPYLDLSGSVSLIPHPRSQDVEFAAIRKFTTTRSISALTLHVGGPAVINAYS
jgi:hypothetical protein